MKSGQFAIAECGAITDGYTPNCFVLNTMAHVSDAILVFGGDCQLIYTNPAARQILGLESGGPQTSMSFDTLFADPTSGKRFLQRLRETPQIHHQECRLRRHDEHGGSIMAFVSLIGHIGSIGELKRIEAIVTDITQQRKTEAALCASEERLRAIVDATQDGLLAVDPETERFVFANDTMGRMLGYSPDSLCEMSVQDIHPEHALPQVIAEFRRHVQFSTDSTELPMLRKDGSEFIADIRSSELILDGKRYLLGAFRDVTDRIRVREIERQYSSVMQAVQRIAHLGHWVWDLPSRTFSWSEEFQEILGSAEGVRLSYPYLLRHIPKDDRNRMKAALRVLLKGRARECSLDHAIETFSGIRRIVQSRIEAELDRNGNTRKLIGSMLDVTDRMDAQIRLKASEQRFREYTEIATDWLWEMDSELRFSYVSPNVQHVMGFDPQDAIGKRREAFHGEYGYVETPEWRQHVEAIERHEPFSEFLVKWNHPDGKMRHLSITGRPRFDAEGRFVGYRGVGKDVTALMASRRREERLRALLNDAFESVSDGLLLFDADDRLVLCNSAYRRQAGPIEHLLNTGLTVEELVRAFVRSGAVVIPDGDEEAWVERRLAVHRSRERHPFTMELRDGRWVEVIEYPTQEGGTLMLRTDITERVRVEQALRSKENRLAEAQSIAHIGSWEFNITTGSLQWSDQVFEIFELDPKHFVPSYEAFLQLIHPDDRAAVKRAYEDSVDNRTPYEITHRLLFEGGRVKYVNERCRTYYAESGKPLRSVGTVQDITERIVTERALRASEVRFDRAVRGSQAGVWDWDIVAEKLYLAPGFKRLLGYGEDEMEDFDLAEWLHPDDRDSTLAAMDRTLKTGKPFDTEYRLPHKQGGYRWVHGRGTTFCNEAGRVTHFAGAITDITERKAAQDALRASEAHFRQIFDSSPLGIATSTIERDYRCLAVNPAFCAMLGYDKEELEGKTVWDITDPRDLDLNRGYNNKVLVGEVTSYTIEKRYRHKNGHVVWARVSSSMVCDAEGNEIGMIGIIEDITQKKQTEEKLKRLNSENKRLARYAISAREDDRKHLARELHDELGQLVTAIRFDTNLISQKGNGMPAEVMEAIEDILRQTDRAQSIIRAMTHRLHPLELDHLGLVDTLRQEISQWERRNPGIRCQFLVEGVYDDLEDSLILDLYRIIQESLTNVVRYSLADEVKIELSREARSSSKGSTAEHFQNNRSAAEAVHLALYDNGVGMDLEKTSLGLGLLGMRERIESHNGRFELQSEPGSGVSISMWIPIFACPPVYPNGGRPA